MLCWHDRGEEQVALAELVNISGGGVALKCREELPQDRPIWLSLNTEHIHTSHVEARVLGYYTDSLSARIARLQFVEPCPSDLYELAVFGNPETLRRVGARHNAFVGV